MRSKLWRTLGAEHPLFVVYSPDVPGEGYVRDSEIHSINISAGTTMAGLSTSAAELTLRGHHSLEHFNAKHLRIDLTVYGRDLLAATCGVSAGSIKERFDGRIAGQKTTDHGVDRRLITTVTAQDWAAFTSQLDVGGYADTNDPNVGLLYRTMFNRPTLPGLPPMETWGTTWHWVKWPDGNAQTYLEISTSDIIGKYAADLGNLLSISRDGTPRAWSHDHLQAIAAEWWKVSPHPIQRSQVLTPVEWTRDVAIPAQTRWTQWDGIGADTWIVYVFPPPDEAYRTDEIDMRHIWDIKSSPGATGLTNIMAARTYRQARTISSIEHVTIDLLGLFRRNQGTDRALIGQLLKMTHGDPVALGWDWPEATPGVYFAQSVEHTITPDTWTVEIDLAPAYSVTGTTPTGDLRGDTWGTGYATTQWDTPATTTWEESPYGQ